MDATRTTSSYVLREIHPRNLGGTLVFFHPSDENAEPTLSSFGRIIIIIIVVIPLPSLRSTINEKMQLSFGREDPSTHASPSAKPTNMCIYSGFVTYNFVKLGKYRLLLQTKKNVARRVYDEYELSIVVAIRTIRASIVAR